MGIASHHPVLCPYLVTCVCIQCYTTPHVKGVYSQNHHMIANMKGVYTPGYMIPLFTDITIYKSFSSMSSCRISTCIFYKYSPVAIKYFCLVTLMAGAQNSSIQELVGCRLCMMMH